MKDKKPSAFRRGVSVLGKLFVGTRKGPSGESVRHLRRVQKRLGVRFTDLSLLEQALTHRSYSHVTSQTRNDSNERMEFLGDSVLGLAVSQFLYLQFPDRSEGALSKMKSLLVSRKVLSSIARDIGLGEHLLLSGEESEMGGRDRASILADSYEGVIGSIYLDQGYRAANQFILRSLLSRIHEILKDDDHTNFKSLLQEYVQSKRLSHPVYRVRKEEGPEHEKEFAVDVVVKGEIWGTGRGKSKKDAEQNAARAALEKRQGRAAKPRRAVAAAGVEEPKPKPKAGRGRGRAESPRPAAEEPRVREDKPAAPRARVRRRGRAEVVEIETSAKDRGDHGIAASREKLRERREAEAEERRRKERDRRGSRRRAGGEEDRADPVSAGRAETTSEGAGEDRERPRRRRRRRRSGSDAHERETERSAASTAPERPEDGQKAGEAPVPAEVESTEARARELRERWDQPRTSPEQDRSAEPASSGTAETTKPEEGSGSRERVPAVPRGGADVGSRSSRPGPPEAEAPGGFVRRRKRRETRPQVDPDRPVVEKREPRPEGTPASEARTGSRPAEDENGPVKAVREPEGEGSGFTRRKRRQVRGLRRR